jgi:hypothetical protein
MMTLGLWLLAAVAAGIAVVVFARMIQRKQFASDRQPIPLDDLVCQVSPPLSPEVFREVWTTIGTAYGIDPRLIKPDDELKRLAAIDSWDLGQGGDKLDTWLRTKNLGPKPRVETVKDLALWVQSGAQT